MAWCSVLLPKLRFCQYQQKILEKQKLNFSRRVLFHRKTTVCLKYFGQDCRYLELANLLLANSNKPTQKSCEKFTVKCSKLCCYLLISKELIRVTRCVRRQEIFPKKYRSIQLLLKATLLVLNLKFVKVTLTYCTKLKKNCRVLSQSMTVFS